VFRAVLLTPTGSHLDCHKDEGACAWVLALVAGQEGEQDCLNQLRLREGGKKQVA
jgi:hypothetical protein